ncbi:thiamine pyrophosphate-dependent enzyme [Chloroflexota bacterium]
MPNERQRIYNYLRPSKRFPLDFCPGCGIGIFLRTLIRAIDRGGYNKDQVVLVSGIGCTGRVTTYSDFNTLHTTHGRALTFATGIKLVKPELKVITIMGDGDAAAIGGNHLLHAARRNIGITAIVLNNSIYGMTGGQLSPTTPLAIKTATSPYGNIENALDICELVRVAGANFVARSTIYSVSLMENLIKRAIEKRGFSFLEVISQCFVQYGKRAGFSSVVEMLEWQRDNSINAEEAAELNEEQLLGKLKVGVLVERDALSYEERLESLKISLKSNNNAV